jgi:hypothetical protein
LVPQEEKNDVFAKVQREENRRNRESQPNRDASSERNSVNGFSQERARSKGKEFARLDNKNPGYVPAHLREQKQFEIDKGLPRLDQVKSSNYGKLEKKSNPNTSKSTLPSARLFQVERQARRHPIYCKRDRGGRQEQRQA